MKNVLVGAAAAYLAILVIGGCAMAIEEMPVVKELRTVVVGLGAVLFAANGVLLLRDRIRLLIQGMGLFVLALAASIFFNATWAAIMSVLLLLMAVVVLCWIWLYRMTFSRE